MGSIDQEGDYYSRDWSFLMTQFVKNISYWNEATPRNADGEMEFLNKGWIPNFAWDIEFEQMPQI